MLVTLAVVSAWDLTIGTFVIDRYLFYLVPVVVLGFVCALLDERRPRWSLVVPAVAVAVRLCHPSAGGLPLVGEVPAEHRQPDRDALQADCRPRWREDRRGRDSRCRDARARRALRASRPAGPPRHAHARLRRAAPRRLPGGHRLHVPQAVLEARPLGPAAHPERERRPRLGRPDVGAGARVTEIPYSTNSSFFVTQQSWRDLEFWNKSIRYASHYPTPDVYDDAVVWFPNTPLAVQPEDGVRKPLVDAVRRAERHRDPLSNRRQGAGAGPDDDADRRRPTLADILADLRPIRRRVDEARCRREDPRLLVSRAEAVQSRGRSAFQIQAPSDVDHRRFSIVTNLASLSGVATNTDTTFENVNVCVPAARLRRGSLPGRRHVARSRATSGASPTRT